MDISRDVTLEGCSLVCCRHVTELTGLSRIGVGIPILNDIKHLETEPCKW